MSPEFLWYIPTHVESGHRGDDTKDGWGSLDFMSDVAITAERHGFSGALIGTTWARQFDSLTVSSALAARTKSFRPLTAIRPGYWQPAHFAAAATTFDHLTEGRLLVNIVSGKDEHRAYGDFVEEPPQRYARTREFMQLVRRLWTEEDVTFEGEYFRVEHSTCLPRPFRAGEGGYPPLYFGGASAAAEEVAAAEADVQLMWGEPLDMAGDRIERLKRLSAGFDRRRSLEFGLRITTLVRETTDAAWEAANENLARWAEGMQQRRSNRPATVAVGQQRLLDLAEKAEVLDSCLWTAPGKVGGGGAGTTWLVGSPDDVIAALRRYEALGISHFILSDTPYLQEAQRVGDLVVSRMQEADARREHALAFRG